MAQKNAKSSGQYFIRVYLCSGTSDNPLGSEELVVFCKCSSQDSSIEEVQKGALLKWVNSNPKCKKNQSNEKYIISTLADAMTVVYLHDREIRACDAADRIFPRLVS